MPRSPLRYPGGKQKAIAKILRCFPADFAELREPLVGGGSVFLAALGQKPQLSCWINDLNPELYWFWHCVQTDLPALVRRVQQVHRETEDGRALFAKLVAVHPETLSPLERATRFFVLNRITFSGTIESGGYSQASFATRFTASSIARLAALAGWLQQTRITQGDYRVLLHAPGDNVLVFLDPPYLSKTHSRLYGRQGDLHTGFDHQRFAQEVAACPHRWLITYDDCPEVRENFAFAYRYEWELQYGMNNYKQAKAERGRELFLSNYPIPT
ncbi:MAG: DNA adenine methylase [Pseudanabaenaceae cyanobacterium]